MRFYKDIELLGQSFRISITHFGNGQLGFLGYSLKDTTNFEFSLTKVFDTHPCIEIHKDEILAAYNLVLSKCVKHAEKCCLQSDLTAMFVSDLGFCFYPKEGLI